MKRATRDHLFSRMSMQNFGPSEGEGLGRILQLPSSQKIHLHEKKPGGRRITWMTEFEVDPARLLCDGDRLPHRTQSDIWKQDPGKQAIPFFPHDDPTFFYFTYFLSWFVQLLINSNLLHPWTVGRLRVITVSVGFTFWHRRQTLLPLQLDWGPRHPPQIKAMFGCCQ